MNVDKALANCEFFWNLQGGDTGKRRGGTQNFLTVETHSPKNVRCRCFKSSIGHIV